MIFILLDEIKKYRIKSLSFSHTYQEYPDITLIIQSFNHVDNIEKIYRKIDKIPKREIIVCEDGSIDGSTIEWLKYLTKKNDFLIRSNDLHELRAYDKASKMAEGNIICLMQDDELIVDEKWCEKALFLFNKFDDLVIIGGWRGINLRKWDFKKNKLIYDRYLSKDLKDIKEIGFPFMYVMVVPIGPFFIRKSFYSNIIKKMDHSFSVCGETGIYFEYDMCMKAWLNNFKVGYFYCDFERGVGGRGTSFCFKNLKIKNAIKNMKILYNRYKDKLSYIYGLVEESNQLIK